MMRDYQKDPRQRSKKVAENVEDHRALRWDDCVKRDLRKAEEEEKWREKAKNREQWKQITVL